MVRQVCPQCETIVELPADSPGRMVSCPNCQNLIVVPRSYEAVVDPGVIPVLASVTENRSVTVSSSEIPEPPPGYVPVPAVPPIHRVEVGAASDFGATQMNSPKRDGTPGAAVEYPHQCAVRLSAGWLAWISVFALTGILVLSFFSWVGAFPGGYRVYTQMPWQAMIGSFSTQTYFDETLAEESELKKHLSGNWSLMLPYLLFLLAGTGFAWAWRLVYPEVMEHWPPPWNTLKGFWPSLPTLLTGLAAAGLFLLLVQWYVGFGLQLAVHARIAEEVARVQEQEKSLSKLPRPFLIGEKTGRYSASPTTIFYVVLALQFITVLAMIGWLWLSRRVGKPAPQILVEW